MSNGSSKSNSYTTLSLLFKNTFVPSSLNTIPVGAPPTGEVESLPLMPFVWVFDAVDTS